MNLCQRGAWKTIFLEVKIAIGTTQGLTFLRTSEKKVVHKDFKASNILLGGNMWDLTLDTDLLKELPKKYTFEDLIDNSLHVVWSNHAGHRKLIRNNAGDQI
ncbi:hypothetical protein P3L10_010361 [Capsicum annuum]